MEIHALPLPDTPFLTDSGIEAVVVVMMVKCFLLFVCDLMTCAVRVAMILLLNSYTTRSHWLGLLEECVERHRFHNNEEEEVAVCGWLQMRDLDLYRDRIFKLVPRCNRFQNNEEEEVAVCEWLRMRDRDLYRDRIFKLVPRCNRCVSLLTEGGLWLKNGDI